MQVWVADMARTLRISIPHRLTPQEVRARLEKGLTDFRGSSFSKSATLSENWQGDSLHLEARAMGQTINGRVHIQPTTVDVEVDLPWALAMLAGKITKGIETEGRKMLEEKK